MNPGQDPSEWSKLKDESKSIANHFAFSVVYAVPSKIGRVNRPEFDLPTKELAIGPKIPRNMKRIYGGAPTFDSNNYSFHSQYARVI